MELTEEKLKIATKLLYKVKDWEALAFYHNLYLYVKNGGSKDKAEMIYNSSISYIGGYYTPDEIKKIVKLYKRIFHNKF